jgi:hypothetical protein
LFSPEWHGNRLDYKAGRVPLDGRKAGEPVQLCTFQCAGPLPTP